MTKAKKKSAPLRSPHASEALEEYEKGVRLLQQKDYQKAIPRFEAILAKHANEQALCDRARAWLRVATGEIAGRQPLRSTREPAECYEVGVFLLNEGETREAVRHLQRAVEHAPKDGSVHLALAAAQAQAGEPASAMASLKRAVELDRSNATRAAALSDFEDLLGTAEFQAVVSGG